MPKPWVTWRHSSAGSRPTLDLMHGLWQRGYRFRIPRRRQLVITDAVREAIRTNTLDQLPGGELSTVSVPLMQDSGWWCGPLAQPIRFTPPRARTAPPILPAGGFRRASPTSFRLPVARAIRKMEAFRSRPLEVFQASLPLGPHAGEAVAGALGLPAHRGRMLPRSRLRSEGMFRLSFRMAAPRDAVGARRRPSYGVGAISRPRSR